MTSGYCYSFPAIRGVQAGRPFYVATCPLRIIPRIFMYDEEELPADLRAQRTLNKSRIPEMVRYLLLNPNDYIFSALTASVGSEVKFEESIATSNIGTLNIPLDAQILINDGQHRRKAIEEAVREHPDLGQDNIAVLFFIDEGLTRSQQMFADLNKYAVKPSPSLSSLYDKRDAASDLARYLAMEVSPFKGFTELEKSNISSNSGKLFTLSGIKQASRALLGKRTKDSYTEDEKHLAASYWTEVFNYIPEWQMVYQKTLSAAEARKDFINVHGLGLHALGSLGNTLLKEYPTDWKEKLPNLKTVDWRKTNPEFQKRSMLHGKLSKAQINIALTANYLKTHFKLELNTDEMQLEHKVK
ncbi:DNA sulfur modification protein DndB [Methylophaga pinxianii]|uniref:DNA sulfur modification protein DndB n=1 Tax=Methylophaga pinxianii TaxID=2881052 RepID=UPI001CF0ED0B|nr:DNA sulfur modification protein DndB [Methylophaga pinxianii]MCB2426042.1 DNA sulfur modification protein DndB [Methylophaga pinxianii]UPH46153.1 DNA sulfur modification protein DndB [Methylophaga pinxianii]